MVRYIWDGRNRDTPQNLTTFFRSLGVGLPSVRWSGCTNLHERVRARECPVIKDHDNVR
jgi:hypothetical protein